MRGVAEFNFPLFEEAEDYLLSLGWDVTSPHRMDLDIGFDPGDFDPNGDLDGFDLEGAARRDIDAIFSVDALVFLPGWENSKGARAEKSLADWIEKPCFLYPGMEILA